LDYSKALGLLNNPTQAVNQSIFWRFERRFNPND